ncbi:flagellin N-terminal helical domain-containing protein [Thalassolituus marinus]|uniref:Flagellin n=1 Tax=Thalassolituus marinus TaxID=671053 RepID=A0ABS7ZLH8_9GAMM|nr:flagellin [Thalassolituus marinus]MCA6062542.1 hypothetical protein [Thalassolituus marinus]
MPQIINTNIASINAQRNLDKSQSANQTALQRLSSGLRINSAKDDAAGLAISTRFTSQIKGLNVAVRNAGDGIALAQTAEGALGSINENLQRIRELAVQSANATNSDVDREALQAEVDQLVSEITRTSEETDFNGRKLLDGSFSATFQIGANAGQTVDVSIAQLTSDKLGVGKANGISALGNENGLQNGDLVINGTAIDPSKASSDTFSVAGNEASAISKVAAINAKSDETGVSAVVNTNVSVGAEMTAAATTGTIKLNDVEIDISTGGLDAATDRDSVISAINAKSGQTGVVARDGGDGSGVILEAKDGRNITVDLQTGGANTLTEASTGLSEGTSYAGYTLISKDGSDIKVEGGQGTGTGDISHAGMSVGTYSGREAAVASKTTSAGIANTETASTFTTGDMAITGTRQINATNNTFEISLNGGDFQTLTLDATFDADGAGALTAGQYNDADTLAAQINNAIENDANFQDADGNVLVTANGNADGSITFTTAEKGADSAVVVRTGEGSFSIPADTVTEAGVDAGTFVQSELNFVFDGTNSLAGGGNLVFALAGNGTGAVAAGAGSTITLGAGPFTSAQTLADDINTKLAASAGLAGKLTAGVSDDGKKVVFTATADKTDGVNGTTGISLDAASTVQTSLLNETTETLANGDVVISDVNSFINGFTATADTVGINVDGAGLQDLDLSTATGGLAGITDATTLAAAINVVATNSLAGSGLTASVVGDQVVISSNSAGGTIALGSANTANETVGGDPASRDAAVSAAADLTTTGVAGSVTTGAFSVSDGTDGFAAGTFLTADPDGAGTEFSAQASPMVIEAGVNDTFTIAVDGGADTNVTIAAGSYSTLEDLATAINAATGMAGASVAVAADDPTRLTFSSDTNDSTGTVEIKNGGTAGTEGAFAVTGGAVDGALVTAVVEPNVLETGDLTINGTSIKGADAKDDTASDTVALSSDAAGSGIAVAAAINKSSAETGVTATVNATTLNGGDGNVAAKADAYSTGSLMINNVPTNGITLTGDEGRDRQAAIDVINAISGQTGVVASDNGESITLTAADGRNISVAIDNNLAENAAAGRDSSNFGNAIGLSAAGTGIGEADLSGTAAEYANTAGTTYSTVTLNSSKAIEIGAGENGADELDAMGLQAGTYGGGEDGTYLKDIDISTFEGAQAAITAVDNAIEQVASQRADLGAIQNRMESTVSNLKITSENLNSANSRIRDTDFAAETAEMSRTQVLQQAGISVLAQANAAGQQVLSLLG